MAGNNAINNEAYSLLGPSYVGVNYVNGYSNINSGSNTIIYTCPAGKRAYPVSVAVHNSTAGSINGRFFIRVSGVDYALGPSRNIVANSTRSGSSAIAAGGWWETMIILEANESLVFNGNGLNVFVTMFEYANNVPVFTSKIINSANANNLVYTVPVNKVAMIGINGILGNGFFWYNTGAATTATAYIVNSGGSPGATNTISVNHNGTGPSLLMTDTSSSSIHNLCSLSSGDFLQLNLVAARNGIIWANIWEVNA